MKLNEKRYGTDNWLKQPDMKKDFISWTSLGVDDNRRKHGTDFLSYHEAQKIVQQAGIKTVTEYRNWKEHPNNMPAAPNKTYTNEWNGWGDFLGTDFLSYHEAQEIVQQAGIKSNQEYKRWKERPSNIPANPNDVYKNDWNSWGEYLGTGNVREKDFLSYKEAQEIVQQAGIETQKEYFSWKERPNNIPTTPNRTYKNEWNGWGEYLGTDFLSYHEAQKIVQKAGIKTKTEYKRWKERPNNIPSNPNDVYKNDWNSWGEFLSTETSSSQIAMKLFVEKRKIAV